MIKKTQSIFEYILVTAAFTVVGVVTFFAGIKGAALYRIGGAQRYYSKDTDLGKIVNTGVSYEELRWPSKFGSYAVDANNYDGTIQQEQIAQPVEGTGYTQGQRLNELYEYEPLNYSIYRGLQNENQN